MEIHNVTPMFADGKTPVEFRPGTREQNAAWARSMPVWSALSPLVSETVVVCRSDSMIWGDDAKAAGLPVAVFAGDQNGGEWFAVNEDGTRGWRATQTKVDEESIAIALVRRDQGYGPGADYP
jgi:hypothetical protein